tara:strand:+ start:162 stop:815 length:654 start_codon:yes stop_codon:yes gene_type:complete
MKHLIAPSMLASDFSNLQSEVKMVNKSEADWLHLDIMDGEFVPNISFGIPVVKSISKHTNKPLDVHLMIQKPERYIQDFKHAGANIITVHFEACTHLHRTINLIKKEGMKAGVAINPHTSANVLSDVLKELDLVCIMSVNPGFGGQSFIENTYKKVSLLNNLKKEYDSHALIQIDGGVDSKNATQLIQCGANVLVAGSSVFKSSEPLQAIKELKNIN